MSFFNLLTKQPLATIAFNMKPVKGPWGGSSIYVTQMERFLRIRGYKVTYRLSPSVNVIILIDPRDDLESKAFGMSEIRKHKIRYPSVKIIHRINECDRRKNTSFIDLLLEKANQIADHTVFISEWLRDYHEEKWFDPSRPHTVIYNGADATDFHPIGNTGYQNDQRSGAFRIVTHHWSAHPLKGYDIYERVDSLIAEDSLSGVEFWVIGRWPENIRWRRARTFPPCNGQALAEKLRMCHAYLTASRWEPCGMHHVEGAQCGLPLIYHEDGGGIVEAGLKYGIGFRKDVASAIDEVRRDYINLRRKVFTHMPSGDRMCLSYLEIIQRIICNA